jgi:GNAT superfamily N-acetyltransferase
LADPPDAIGSALALKQDRTAYKWAKRLVLGLDSDWDQPLLAEINKIPAGLTWGRIESDNPEVAYLYQVWVAPEYRNCGAGKILLENVISRDKQKDVLYLEKDVTYRDRPARHLNSWADFKPVGEPQPLQPGSELLEQTLRFQIRSLKPRRNCMNELPGSISSGLRKLEIMVPVNRRMINKLQSGK